MGNRLPAIWGSPAVCVAWSLSSRCEIRNTGIFLFFFPEPTWICTCWKLLLKGEERKCHTVRAHWSLDSTIVQLHAWEDAETKQATKDNVSLHTSLTPFKIQWNIIKYHSCESIWILISSMNGPVLDRRWTIQLLGKKSIVNQRVILSSVLFLCMGFFGPCLGLVWKWFFTIVRYFVKSVGVTFYRENKREK